MTRLRSPVVPLTRFRPAPQHLRHAPRLGNAAARRVGRLGVEHFTDGPDAEVVERGDAAAEERARAGHIAGMHLQPGVNPGADEPPPNGTLMVRRVTRAKTAIVE